MNIVNRFQFKFKIKRGDWDFDIICAIEKLMNENEGKLKRHPSLEEMEFESRMNKLEGEGLGMMDFADWLKRSQGREGEAYNAERRGGALVRQAMWERQIRFFKKVLQDASWIRINEN